MFLTIMDRIERAIDLVPMKDGESPISIAASTAEMGHLVDVPPRDTSLLPNAVPDTAPPEPELFERMRALSV